MRTSKLFAAMTASLLLLAGCSAPAKEHIKAPVEPVTNDIPELTITGAEMNANEWYQEMCDEILQFKCNCVVHSHITNQDVKKALAHLPSDHPEIFWLGNRTPPPLSPTARRSSSGCLTGSTRRISPIWRQSSTKRSAR